MNSTKALLTIFIEPGKVFEDIQKRGFPVLPLIVILLAQVALFAIYYQVVDFPWLLDSMFVGIKDPVQLAAGKKLMSKAVLMGSSIGGIVVATPTIFAVYAVYFLLASKLRGVNVDFGHWFSFAVWVSVPSALSLPIGLVQIALAQHGQIVMEALNPLNLNELVFHLESTSAWFRLLNSFNLISIWSLVLSYIGYQVMAKQSRLASAITVLLPTLVVYGGWIGYLVATGK